MPIHHAAAQSVTQRTVNTRDGRTSTIYDILTDDNTKFSTWKQPVANEANRLIGTPAEFTYTVKQNGQYENYYLDDVRALIGQAALQPRGGYAPAEQAMQAQQPGRPIPQQAPIQQAPPQQQAPPIQQAPQEGTGTPKDWSIWRQTAGKVAATLAQTGDSPQDFWRNVATLTTYFATGLVPPEYDGTQHRQENQYIPASAYSETPSVGETENYDSDIPFNNGF